MRNLSLLTLIPALFTGCGALLMTDGESEIRHRYYAVYSEDLKSVVVADETYHWDCSGTMARCYDHESDYSLALFRIDPADTAKRDTLLRVPGATTFPGGYDDPILFLNLGRNMLLHGRTDSSHQRHLMLSDAQGKGETDLYDAPGLRDRYLMAVTPNPAFSRAAAVGHGNRRGELVVLFFDLEKRALADSVVIAVAPEDTTARFGRGVLWESDSSLVIYGKGSSSMEGEVGYRVKGAILTDTIPRFGCLPYRATSSGPVDGGGTRIRWSETGLSREPAESWRCKPE
jgi:hypothetical protein